MISPFSALMAILRICKAPDAEMKSDEYGINEAEEYLESVSPSDV